MSLPVETKCIPPLDKYPGLYYAMRVIKAVKSEQ